MLHERTRCLAKQHLTAVGRGADSGAPMHVQADVPFDATSAFAGMQPHPDPQRDPVRPLGTSETVEPWPPARVRPTRSGKLQIPRRRWCPPRPPLVATAARISVRCLSRIPAYSLGYPFKHPGGPLYVGEEERHGARRQIRGRIRRSGARNRTAHAPTLQEALPGVKRAAGSL